MLTASPARRSRRPTMIQFLIALLAVMSPSALPVGPAAANSLLVGDFNGNLRRYNAATGAEEGVLVPAGAGGLAGPVRLALGPDGNLYVSAEDLGSVLRFNASTGMFGPDRNLYVCSFYTNQVLRYNGKTGAFMNAFVSAIPSSPMSLLFLPPQAPSGLVVGGVIETQVRLEWADNSDDESVFVVQRRGPGADWTDVQTLPAGTTTFVDRGLVPGATYDYRVRAASAVGNSRWSNAVTVTTLSPLPAPPANLEAVPISPTQISLTWDSTGHNVDGYLLWRKQGNDNWAPLAAVGGGVTRYIDAGLQPNLVYTYRVRSFNTLAASEWSNEAIAATPLAAPLAPTNLRATVVSATRVDLTWQVTVTNETAVSVWRKTGSGAFQRVAVLPPGSTSYNDLSVTTGRAYTYQVRTANDLLASPWSNAVTVTTP